MINTKTPLLAALLAVTLYSGSALAQFSSTGGIAGLPGTTSPEIAAMEAALKSAAAQGGLSRAADTAANGASRDQLVVVNPSPAGRMFGSILFGGTFRGTLNPGFNPEYQLAVGDRILVRLWGASSFDGAVTVDPMGNIFVPGVGPISVAGIRSGEINKTVERGVRKIYRESTGVYAALDVSQPVKVFVTGFVRQPGLYGGVSSDSPISFIDKAGGVDQERGSYVEIVVKRGSEVRKRVNLYSFLLDGTLDAVQFQDGDVVVVGARKHTFSVTGEAFNANDFEFAEPSVPLQRALDMAKVKPGATHVSIIRRQGAQRRTEYFPLSAIGNVMLNDGDSVNVSTDRYQGTIQIRVEGAHSGEHAVVLPYGATMADVIKQLKTNPMSRVDSLQLYRRSVALRQKEMLGVSLRKLEEAALSARSATQEEANLRAREAELIMRFVERARTIEPKGQVVLSADQMASTLLEDGDTIVIPERSSLIMVHGEVLFPNAMSWQQGLGPLDYIKQRGGFTQSSDTSKVVLLKQNGDAIITSENDKISAGDELLVLPKIESKNLEVTRGLTQILYQIAVFAKVALGL